MSTKNRAKMMDQPRQDRRRRALQRFQIRKLIPTTPDMAKLIGLSVEEATKLREKRHAAYVERKNIELSSLQARVGAL